MAGPQTRNHTGTSQKQMSELPGTHSRTNGVAVIDDDGEENARKATENAENTEIEAAFEEVVKVEAEVAPTASPTLPPCSSGTTSSLTPL